MTWEQFLALVEAGENPYLMAFEDPTLEDHMMRFDREIQRGIEFTVSTNE